MDAIRDFITEYIQREYTFPAGADIMSIDYRAEGYIDSMGMIMFVASIEDEFGIEFTDEDMMDHEINTVGGIIAITEKKVRNL